MTYIVGSNMVGCLPESEPYVVGDDMVYALEVLAEEIERDADDHFMGHEDGELAEGCRLCDEYESALITVRAGYPSAYVGYIHYWADGISDAEAAEYLTGEE